MPTAESPAAQGMINAWQYRKTWARTWTRSDSARYLDDKKAEIFALLAANQLPRYATRCKNIGQWLALNQRRLFDQAHTRLSSTCRAEGKAAAEALPVEKVLL